MFNQHTDVYVALAAELGLRVSPPLPHGLLVRTIQLDGMVRGRPVSVQRRSGKYPSVGFRAPLAFALDLGLSVRSSGAVESLKELLGVVGLDVEVGDARFDDAFAVRADEPRRAVALLQPAVRAALLPWAGHIVIVGDDDVMVHHPLGLLGPREDDALLRVSLHAVVDIATAIDAARPAVPPPSDVAPLLPRLDAFARDRGLAVAFDAPARAEGRLGGCPVWVLARRRRRGQHDLELGARFEHRLDIHFGITTARTGLGTWLLGDDLEFGDRAFDSAFDAQTDAPERLLALLDEACRATLLELGRGRLLRLDSTGLYVSDSARDLDDAALPLLLDRMADLVRSLERRAHLPARAGYR